MLTRAKRLRKSVFTTTELKLRYDLKQIRCLSLKKGYLVLQHLFEQLPHLSYLPDQLQEGRLLIVHLFKRGDAGLLK